MRKTTYIESAHTADTTHPPADASLATSGLPNRLMTAFEVAEFVGCHEETVRRAYLRSARLAAIRRPVPALSPARRAGLDPSRRTDESVMTMNGDGDGWAITL
jgi:hypothetical protein